MSTDEPMTKLRKWRLDHDLSLADVEDLTGVSVSQLSRAERGQRELAALTKAKVARRLGVPIRELFELEAVA